MVGMGSEHREGGVTCSVCGRQDPPVAQALGVCVSCIRAKTKGSLETALHSHAQARKIFGLPESPPTGEGIHCKLCSQHCRMGEGELGYCGLRWNENGKILALSTPQQGLFHAFSDPQGTTCSGTFGDPGATGAGYPASASAKGQEHEYVTLSIFLYGCSFDCLFCQNIAHKQFHANWVRPVEDLVKMTLQNTNISCWRFFGGSPEPQLPFAIHASELILDALKGERLLRICFEWNGCGYSELMKKAARLAYESGGNVQFDLKAWDENLNIALTGVSNKVVYENFEMVARAYSHSPGHPSWLCATTRLVPGYVDEREVGNMARFMANLDPSIPYGLLVFQPDFMMRDLPVTPVHQVRACYQIAKKYLQHVHVENLHLLGLSDEEALGACRT
jgi:pyruvate formate lyase activating enzyme